MKPMLAKDYDGRDPTGLWMSEKFDGVRACWNGEGLYTRSGNRIDCPAWFTAGLPQIDLDGELWAGRGNFQLAKGTVQSRGRDAEWRKIKFVVFDAPSSVPFESRMHVLSRTQLPGNATVALQRLCHGADMLSMFFKGVKDIGGEGAVLRLPSSPYLFGQRSAYWMKVKRNPALYKASPAE